MTVRKSTDQVRRPPFSEEAERSVIGAMMQSPEALEACFELVDEDDFYREAHSLLYVAMRDLYAKKTPIDTVTLCEYFRTAGKLDLVGGVTAMSDIVMSCPTPGSYEHYARIVKEKAGLRDLIVRASRILERAYNEEPYEEIASDISKAAASPTSVIKDDPESVVGEVEEQLGQIQNGIVRHFVPSGFQIFDACFGGGFERGTLTVVTGPSEVGKSLLLQQCLLRMARAGACTGYVMLDSNKLTVPKRLLCSMMGVSYEVLHTTDNTMRPSPELYAKCIAELKQLPIRLVGQKETQCSFRRVYLWARRHVRDNGMSALIIDSASQIRVSQEKGQSKEEAIAELVNSLLLTAQDLNIPVIVISEMNRDKESSTVDRLKGSGRWTYGADIVLEVTREKDDHGAVTNRMIVRAVKHRHGHHNEARFKGDRSTFTLKEV